MIIYKVLSLLLCYPDAKIQEALNEMADIINADLRLSKHSKQSLLALIAHQRGNDLLDLQENYVDLFDRGRFLSLHIFEHVHGESRERGQAMVNLLAMYQGYGFAIDSRELPDYLPLFLEFLSQLPTDATALQLLQDAMPVLSLLGARLAERDSAYAAIFEVLAELAGEPEQLAVIRQQVANEGEDETLIHIDEIWEEEAVSFMAGGDSCKKPSTDTSPINMIAREQFNQMRQHSQQRG